MVHLSVCKELLTFTQMMMELTTKREVSSTCATPSLSCTADASSALACATSTSPVHPALGLSALAAGELGLQCMCKRRLLASARWTSSAAMTTGTSCHLRSHTIKHPATSLTHFCIKSRARNMAVRCTSVARRRWRLTKTSRRASIQRRSSSLFVKQES
jgi:hypothetical protein